MIANDIWSLGPVRDLIRLLDNQMSTLLHQVDLRLERVLLKRIRRRGRNDGVGRRAVGWK